MDSGTYRTTSGRYATVTRTDTGYLIRYEDGEVVSVAAV